MTTTLPSAYGDYPSTWNVLPLLAVARESEVANTDLREVNLLSLSFGRIVQKDINSSSGLLPESFGTYQIVEPGMTVCRFTDLQNDQRSLRTALVEQRGIITSAYVAVDPFGLDSHYFAYLMRSYDLNKVFYAMGGGVRQGIRYDDVRRLPVPVPPMDEQRRIADFLDAETAQIDALIAELEHFIRQLGERRSAVIERAVFGGINNAATAAHAEPWILPTVATWTVTQLGFVADTLAGYAFASDGFTVNTNDTRLLRGINIKPGRTDWSETVYWDEANSPVPSAYALAPGDIVLGMDRPFVGGGVRVTALTEQDIPALLLQRVMRIRLANRGSVGYLRYLLETRSFYAYLSPMFTGVSVPHMSEWQVRKFKMPYPPEDEQRQITDFLDESTASIDSLISEAKHNIALSRERRAALITAAVTGQIDLTNGRAA
ncbi:restriction endonuclease subunit S [Pseudactinotalea terrae]|uniref:restriction endonuclease subunit S n=1 Tax=Pseudactinotalea terrae TaxID=1743262 RepID=UPI0012E130ED|nr:restriction endonuclease subunit S [Pseudactinotalea terrae]